MAVCIAAMNALVELGPQTRTAFGQMSANEVRAISTQTQMQDKHLTPISQKMCEWAAPRYNEIGEGWDRTAKLAAEVAIYSSVIALNTYVQNQNYKIARAYTDISLDKWNRFKNAYAALEKKMLNETANTPEPTVPYSEANTRAVNASSFAFSSAKSSMTSYAKRYALCMDDSLDLSRAQALMRDDTINFNYRDAENFTEYKSDKRWNRRSAILNLGRNNYEVSFNYAKHASAAFGDLSNAVAGIGNGLSGLLGYMFNRNQTVYPAQFSQASLFGNGALIGTSGASTTVGF